MSKALYIGNKDTAFIFHEVSKQSETELEVFAPLTVKNAEEIISKCLSDNYEIIIMNAEELYDCADSIMDIIKTIVKSSKAKFVLMAQGYAANSNLIVNAAKLGVGFFMIDKDITSCKEVFVAVKANMRNVGSIVDVYKMREKPQKQNFVNASEKFNSKTIGVAGIMNRIGTTTVAVQLAKYFISKDKTVCIIDTSTTKYWALASEYYSSKIRDDSLNMVNLAGIDIYYSVTAEIMQQIYIKNYNYMIFDVGCIADSPAKQTEFLQKDFRLLVAGSKPNEYEAFYPVVQSMYRTAMFYIFNFVPVDERETISEDIGKINGNTYFFPLLNDCFSLVNESITLFDGVFAKEFPVNSEVVPNEPKKKGFFKQFGRKKNENK